MGEKFIIAGSTQTISTQTQSAELREGNLRPMRGESLTQNEQELYEALKMDKESCSPDPDRRDKSGLMDAARTLDPSSLFAYWPRGDSGTSAATNALFGAYGSGSSLTGGRGSYGSSGSSSNVPNAAAYGNTLSVAASQAASLGINPASAAWWTVASHLAAQDYLARLHSMSFAGLPGAETLYPNFLLSPGANSPVSNKTSSKSNSSSSMPSSNTKTHSSSSFSGSEKEKENYSTPDKERDRERNRDKEKDRDRDRERERVKDKEKEREKDRERERERDKDKDKDSSLSLSPVTAHSGSKSDHLASIAALANSGTSVTPFPPQAHSSVGDSSGMLGGVRLPPDTEIIKYTSSIGGPKIPGTTNRGRKKTISLDPPSVSVMPTHSSTGIPIDLGQPYRSQVKLDSDGAGDQVEVIKLPAHSSSNGVVPPSSETGDDAPLNLCTKSRDKDDANSDKDRVSRRKPVPKPRRPPSNESNPITSLSAMSQIFTPELNSQAMSAAEEDAETSPKDGRPRNLGRGVSKPKKNTVASLLAQSRALGLKGPLPGDFASQLAALKASLPSDITSQLALLQNFQSPVEDVDGGDKRSLTPENPAVFDRVRTSEDGSLTTDSTSTGGSDSESENGNKVFKSKKEKNQDNQESSKSTEKNSTSGKVKDEYKETKSPQPVYFDEREQKRNSVPKDQQLLYTQEINKQKELLYAVELEKERRRQHMTLIRALENRKRIEERERKRIELRAEKIARHEKKVEQRRLELELLKELRKPTEDMELDDLKPFPELSRINGLKLSGQAFADTLMVFEFLHNFGETLGFDMESLPTLNNLQGALLNDEENEEELLSIMTHLLVCAIEDPGIPNPARHITLLGQSLKQADITHTNISEILRIYLYANATGEVKALTGLNFERDREKKISEHHNLYGEEAQNQGTGKNAAFFEHLYENPTYKLSEELKEKPFLALNPTTKSAILAFLCNELLQNKAVLRQIEGSLETVILSRRERWMLDQSIRKLRCLHDRQIRYSMISKDKENIGGVNPQVGQSIMKEKTDGVDSDVDSPEDSDHESEITQPEEDDQQQNLNSEEISKRLEKLIKQQESHLATLRTSNQQIRAMCLGQDRFWRRYWCLPRCGSIFVESMESAQPDEYSDIEEDLQAIKPAQESEDTEKSSDTKTESKESDAEENSCEGKHEKKKSSKRKSKSGSRHAKKSKSDPVVSTEHDASDSENQTESNNDKTDVSNTNETNPNNVTEDLSENKIKSEIPDSEIKEEIECKDDGEKTVKENTEVKKVEKADVDTQTGERDIKTEDEMKVEVKNEPETVPSAEDAQLGVDEKAEVKVKLENLNNDIKKAEEYFRAFKDPMKEYSEKFKELSEMELNDGLKGMKYFKEYFFDMSRNFENEMHLKDLAEKCKYEDDPLLRAMKIELSNRIFGPSGNSIKKEDMEDPQLYRNSGSPLANGDKFAPFGLLPNNFNLNRENDPDAQWFSILPKESCDSKSLMLGKNESEKLSVPLNIPSRVGLPPSPGPIPLCDSPAPLILSPEEAAMLEHLKSSGPKATPTPKSVPRHLRRGWWRMTDEKQLHEVLECLHNRGIRERELKRMLTRYLEDTLETGGKSSTLTGGSELMDLENSGDFDGRVKFLDDGAPVKDQPHSWDQNVFERVENLLLEQVENLEDKVASASMQVKGWRVPSRSNPSEGNGDSKRLKIDPIEIAKQRLISLEAAIERRYLKPPLGFSTGEGGIGIQADQDESIPKGLGIWREAVLKSHTAAQLSMALYMLESCIAWDKSIMKANCQFCQSGDNEDKLLLCDGCDRGYHMYCFKPKMETIPEGDWYCHECKNKANGERNCIVCGKRPIKNFVTCEHCPRIYHADCLNPPLLKIPRNGKWNCVACAIKFPKKKCGRKLGWRKNKESKGKDDLKDHRDTSNSGIDDKTNDTFDGKNYDKSDGESDGEDVPLSASFSSKDKECVPLSPIPSATCSNSAVSDEPPPLSPQPPTGVVPKKERVNKKLWKELNACKTLVEEMELQDEAWPFLLPVNTKQFPTYRKIIKCPMDISTIKKRLTEGLYKTKEEFVFDVRQIFNNCETFNEDDSPVGKAGHAMRSFFETRWGEITNQKSSP